MAVNTIPILGAGGAVVNTGPPPAEDNRITEASDNRITEAGDQRVTE